MASQTSVPTRKVVAGGATGAFVTLLIYVLNAYVPFFKTQPITAEAASLATTVLGAVIAYVVPPGPSETTIKDVATGAVKSATA